MRYKILGTSHIKIFIHIMTQLQITHNDAIASGVSEEEINKVNKIAVDKKIVILALPDDLFLSENMNRVFQFVPMNKESESSSGVFVPVEVGDNIEDYDSVIEAPLLPNVQPIRDLSNRGLSNMFYDHETGDGNKMGDEMKFVDSVKQEGRPNRKKTINKDDIEEMNHLLKAGSAKDIDVNDFLKLI